jgi:hypothetical protein
MNWGGYLFWEFVSELTVQGNGMNMSQMMGIHQVLPYQKWKLRPCMMSHSTNLNNEV